MNSYVYEQSSCQWSHGSISCIVCGINGGERHVKDQSVKAESAGLVQTSGEKIFLHQEQKGDILSQSQHTHGSLPTPWRPNMT